jgi:hypothetical protein
LGYDGFVTGEAARERFRVLADQVDAAYDEMRTLSCDEVGSEFRVELAERLENQERTNRGLMYPVFGQIADPPDEVSMVSAVAATLSARLRVPPHEIKRRMKIAARLRPRRQLTGPPLAPELAHLATPTTISMRPTGRGAAAWCSPRAGWVHTAVIRSP